MIGCEQWQEWMLASAAGDLEPRQRNALLAHTSSCATCDERRLQLHQAVRVLEAMYGSEPQHATLEGAARRLSERLAGTARLVYGGMDTPVGPVMVAMGERGIRRVGIRMGERQFVALLERERAIAVPNQEQVAPVLRELAEYFQRGRRRFEQPLDLSALTAFQRRVLEATSAIPPGSVTTYIELAGRIGHPRAARAVGNALGRNPLPIIIPCHRVLRRSGELGGYTGGPEVKRQLLALEGAVASW